MNPPSFFNDAERGLPRPTPPPPPRDGQPQGNAKFPLAHPEAFASLFNTSARTYDKFYDEALRYGWDNQHRMLFDPVIQSALRLRTTASVLATSHVEPDDDTDEFEQRVSKIAHREISNMRQFAGFKRWLVWDGIWKGRTAAMVRWEKRWNAKERRLIESPACSPYAKSWRPICGDKLAFKWDGRVGVQVMAAYASGETEVVPTYGRVRFFDDDERRNLVVFQYEPEDGDFYKPWEAGRVEGVGLRQRLFWLWALKSRLWAASIDFLEFWARGIIVWYFRSGNETHKTEMLEYLAQFNGKSDRVHPWDATDGFKPFDRIEPAGGTNSFLQELITNYLDDLIRQLILGQTLTTQASPTGLGSSVAQAHQQTFEQLVKYDADFFDDCMTHDLVRVWYEANYPGVRPGRWKTQIDSPNVQQLLDAAEAIYGMGGNVPEDPLLEAAGLPEVKEGDTVLTQVAQTQPAAVGGLPEGTPVLDAGAPQQAPEPTQGPVRMSAKTYLDLRSAARKGDARAVKLLRRIHKRDIHFT